MESKNLVGDNIQRALAETEKRKINKEKKSLSALLHCISFSIKRGKFRNVVVFSKSESLRRVSAYMNWLLLFKLSFEKNVSSIKYSRFFVLKHK